MAKGKKTGIAHKGTSSSPPVTRALRLRHGYPLLSLSNNNPVNNGSDTDSDGSDAEDIYEGRRRTTTDEHTPLTHRGNRNKPSARDGRLAFDELTPALEREESQEQEFQGAARATKPRISPWLTPREPQATGVSKTAMDRQLEAPPRYAPAPTREPQFGPLTSKESAEAIDFFARLPSEVRNMCIQKDSSTQQLSAIPNMVRDTAKGPSSSTPILPDMTISGETTPTYQSELHKQLPAYLPPTGIQYMAQPTAPEATAATVTIAPNLDGIPSYMEENSEGWESYIERWEVLMAPYSFSNEQLALALPGKLIKSAWETYRTLIKMKPECANNYKALKEELSKAFTAGKPLQERGLWPLKQGTKTVAEFYSEVISTGQNAFKGMPDEYREQVLKGAFVSGLRERYQEVVLNEEEMSLALTVAKAKKLEAIEKALSKNRVAVIEQKSDRIEPLVKQIEGLAELVQNQNRTRLGWSTG